MSLMASFCAVLFPKNVLDEIWDLIESVFFFFFFFFFGGGGFYLLFTKTDFMHFFPYFLHTVSKINVKC